MNPLTKVMEIARSASEGKKQVPYNNLMLRAFAEGMHGDSFSGAIQEAISLGMLHHEKNCGAKGLGMIRII